MEENEQIPIRLGGYANSHRPISSGTKRDKAVLMGLILGAHLVLVAVLVALTRSSSVTSEASGKMVEVVDYYDIATVQTDGTMTSPTEEAKRIEAAAATAAVATPEGEAAP